MPDHLRLVRDLAVPIANPLWPDGITVTRLSAALAPRIHTLLQRAYANGGGSVPPDFDTWWASTRHDPEFDARLSFVAAAEGEPVGFALCWRSGFIKDLVVHPEHQGTGIGTALLLTALRELAKRGHRQAALKVHTDNKRARQLYAANGFVDGS